MSESDISSPIQLITVSLIKDINLYGDGSNAYFCIVVKNNFRKNNPSWERKSTPLSGFLLLVNEEGVPFLYQIHGGKETRTIHSLPLIDDHLNQCSLK